MGSPSRGALRLAGSLVGATAYDLLSRVEQLGLSAGQSLTVDISAVTDIDVASLAALRELFQTVLAQRIDVTLTSGNAPEPIRDAVATMLKAATDYP